MRTCVSGEAVLGGGLGSGRGCAGEGENRVRACVRACVRAGMRTCVCEREGGGREGRVQEGGESKVITYNSRE